MVKFINLVFVAVKLNFKSNSVLVKLHFRHLNMSYLEVIVNGRLASTVKVNTELVSSDHHHCLQCPVRVREKNCADE